MHCEDSCFLASLRFYHFSFFDQLFYNRVIGPGIRPVVLLLFFYFQYGGFQKFPEDATPDLYHSYYGLAALSLLEEPGLVPLCVELGIPSPEIV